jgi:hypothetical protein
VESEALPRLLEDLLITVSEVDKLERTAIRKDEQKFLGNLESMETILIGSV